MNLRSLDQNEIITEKLCRVLELVEKSKRDMGDFKTRVEILLHWEFEERSFEQEVGYVLKIINECAYGNMADENGEDLKKFHALYASLVNLFWEKYFEKR